MAISTNASVLDRLGVSRLINAAGIYTDLGGSCLSPTVWAELREVNANFASLPELLDRSGDRIAELVGAEAARIAPGASASIALMTAACIAQGDGTVSETLPTPPDAHEVILQAGHQNNYARCVLLAGAIIRKAGTPEATSVEDLERAIGPDTRAVLFAAHLGAEPGTLPLETVVKVAHQHGIRVLVDAAYMSYPLELIPSYTNQGADLACFSAKYYYGPNAGGFILGTREALADVEAVDFTEYESGPFRNFGRALKMDRITVAATMLALEEWYELDHVARWATYAARVNELQSALADVETAELRPCQYTLGDWIDFELPVNALAMTPMPGGPTLEEVTAALAASDPPIKCSSYGGSLAVCVETLLRQDQDYLVERLRAAWTNGA